MSSTGPELQFAPTWGTSLASLEKHPEHGAVKNEQCERVQLKLIVGPGKGAKAGVPANRLDPVLSVSKATNCKPSICCPGRPV